MLIEQGEVGRFVTRRERHGSTVAARPPSAHGPVARVAAALPWHPGGMAKFVSIDETGSSRKAAKRQPRLTVAAGCVWSAGPPAPTVGVSENRTLLAFDLVTAVR